MYQNILGPIFETDRQVVTVAMETTQLVLSQFKKNFLASWIENWIRFLHAKNNWWTLWIGEIMSY